VSVFRACGSEGLAAKARDSLGAVGQGGQSKACAECRAELRVRESEAAGG
jgi:hypothetical protein